MRGLFARSDEHALQRFRFSVAVTIIGLLLPLAVLFLEGYRQLRRGTFFHDRALAHEFSLALEDCLRSKGVTSEMLLADPQVVQRSCGAFFERAKLAQRVAIVVRIEGQVVFEHEPDSIFSPTTGESRNFVRGAPVFFTKLSGALDKTNITYYSTTIPRAGGATLWGIVVVSFVVVVPLGLLVIYFMGVQYIERARERANFAAAITHELKTPLAGMRLHAELLQAKVQQMDNTQVQSLQSQVTEVLSGCERLTALVEDILELTKQGARAKLEVQSKGVTALLEQSRDCAAELATASGFEIHVEPTAEQAQVLVHQSAFERIIGNLVKNALAFAAQAEPKRIEIGARFQRRRIGIYVRDFGPGVPWWERRKIFRLFYRGGDELRRRTPGTGIGLALSRQLAERMNARLEIEDARPGARFVLYLRRTTPLDSN